MKRPDTVPANAIWDNKVNQWELGTLTPAGTRTGTWTSWHKEGHLCATTDYDTAAFTRYHPDGTVSREGSYTWPGSIRWIRSEKPTHESFPVTVPTHSKIRIVEYDFVAPYIVSAQRFFNQQHEPLCEAGVPLPERPDGVPEHAHFHYLPSGKGPSKWVMGLLDTRQGAYTGHYEEWNKTGAQLLRCSYDPATFEETERHEYVQGHLRSSFIHGSGNCLLSKKYFNDTLIYEAILPGRKNKTPLSVNYYYPDGTILLTYQSNKNGTGTWLLYKQNGALDLSMPVHNEAEHNKSDGWNKFLSNPGSIEHVNIKPEWEVVIEKFKTAYKAAQPKGYPPFLQLAFDKTDWAEIDCAMGQETTLPKYIHELLSDDAALATNALTRIWKEIEHQGTLYDATYKIGTIIITCIQQHTNTPLLLNFLFDILALPGIEDDKKGYKELIKALTQLSPILLGKANDADDVVALKALYLLYHTGPAAATLLKQTYENDTFSLFRRSYALFSLGELYLKTKQVPILITEFSAVLTTAKEQLIRLILSIHLVTATKKTAQEAWLAELVKALTTPATVKSDFNELHPFIGEYDVQEYILMVLSYTHPDILEQNILPIIDLLPTVHAMKQETLLDAIFSVLFAKKTALKNMTPIRKQALLAAAEVIDKEVVFVNHKDIFRAYGLPPDADKLRQLAETA